jgi:hypothetical protein
MHNLPILPIRELRRKAIRTRNGRFLILIKRRLSKFRLLQWDRHDSKGKNTKGVMSVSSFGCTGKGEIDLEILSFGNTSKSDSEYPSSQSKIPQSSVGDYREAMYRGLGVKAHYIPGVTWHV